MRFGSHRISGILLHPTSLPGPYGVGALGAHARGFVDFLHNSGQSVWQVLPLGPTGYGDSPYACFSTFAGNPLMIDLDSLAADGLVEPDELREAPPSSDKVDFGAVIVHKQPLLHKAAARFLGRAPVERRREFETFCETQRWWLEDFALFSAIKKAHGNRPLNEWHEHDKSRSPDNMRRAYEELSVDLHATRVQQFYFFQQWHELRAYAHLKGVMIMGDMPIFVAYDSAEVWAHRELFKLDEQLEPRVIAGVPPDYFSATGQLWGNPLYDWPRHVETGFAWWMDRLRHALNLADVLRLDHFRGFEAAWEVPAGETTAQNGTWVLGPGDRFFNEVRTTFGSLPLVAEDLGLITDDVHALRSRHGLPGMHVLQFGFTPHGDRVYAPHNAAVNSVVYTGTHDNDTTVGWFHSLPHDEQQMVKAYLNTEGSAIQWSMIRAACCTAARTTIIPMQDVLGLGSEARMNVPGQVGANWAWRMTQSPHPAAAAQLREFARLYERLPSAHTEP